jgi:ribosomal protein L37AE/L43A
MELLIFWLSLSIAIGIWASKRGRSGLGWFALAVLFSPLLAGVFLLVSRNLAIEQAAQEGIAHTKQCPRCAERVQKKALVCRFCGYEFDGQYIAPLSDGYPVDGQEKATQEAKPWNVSLGESLNRTGNSMMKVGLWLCIFTGIAILLLFF